MSTNYLGQDVPITLHPWVDSVMMMDQGPGTNSDGVYQNYNRIAILNQQMAIPWFDYVINLDIDGDAFPIPPPFSGTEFNITCTIETPSGGTPCAKVYPLLPPGECLSSAQNWQFSQTSVSNTVARITCTNVSDNPDAPFVWPNCTPGAGYGLLPWFGITPIAGHTLSRWNCNMGADMFAPYSSVGWNFTESENEPSYGLTSTTDLMDIDGTTLGPAQWPASEWENFAMTLVYTDPNTLQQEEYLNHWGNGCGSCSWPGGNPSGAYSADGLPGSGNWIDSQESGFFYLLDTNTDLGDPDYLDIFGDFSTNIDDVLNNPSMFINNNVIAMFGGMFGWIPGENPPDINFTIRVNNCGMIDWENDFEEEEWIGFDNLYIYESDNEDIEEDEVIIFGEGSFDEEWGEDE